MMLLSMARGAVADMAVDARFGTTGLGGELILPLGDRVSLRGGYYGGSFVYDTTVDDIEYSADLSLSSAAILLDWHPGGGGFRLCAGAYYNGNEAKATARPTEAEQIGDITFSPQQIGTLRGDVEFSMWAAYAGFGFGHALGEGSRWTVLFDVGIMYHGEPDFTLTSNGSLAETAYFQRELAKEEQEIEDDYISKLRYYPVLSLGLAYRF